MIQMLWIMIATFILTVVASTAIAIEAVRTNSTVRGEGAEESC